MKTLIECPNSHVGEWNFSLFGIPVHVKIWFWIMVLILCGDQPPAALFTWVAVCFVSILLHELGHVLAFRWFGVDAEVVLYGWGGLAVPHRSLRGAMPRVAVALAGPLAGFALAGLTLVAGWFLGGHPEVRFHMLLPTIAVWPAGGPAEYQHVNLYLALNDLLYINLYWGLVNLLPVYPLDGGQAARALYERHDPYNGRRKSLILSAVVAGAVALWGISQMSLYLLLLFGVLAVSSLQALEGQSGWGVRRPSGYWR